MFRYSASSRERRAGVVYRRRIDGFAARKSTQISFDAIGKTAHSTVAEQTRRTGEPMRLSQQRFARLLGALSKFRKSSGNGVRRDR